MSSPTWFSLAGHCFCNSRFHCGEGIKRFYPNSFFNEQRSDLVTQIIGAERTTEKNESLQTYLHFSVKTWLPRLAKAILLF